MAEIDWEGFSVDGIYTTATGTGSESKAANIYGNGKMQSNIFMRFNLDNKTPENLDAVKKYISTATTFSKKIGVEVTPLPTSWQVTTVDNGYQHEIYSATKTTSGGVESVAATDTIVVFYLLPPASEAGVDSALCASIAMPPQSDVDEDDLTSCNSTDDVKLKVVAFRCSPSDVQIKTATDATTGSAICDDSVCTLRSLQYVSNGENSIPAGHRIKKWVDYEESDLRVPQDSNVVVMFCSNRHDNDVAGALLPPTADPAVLPNPSKTYNRSEIESEDMSSDYSSRYNFAGKNWAVVTDKHFRPQMVWDGAPLVLIKDVAFHDIFSDSHDIDHHSDRDFSTNSYKAEDNYGNKLTLNFDYDIDGSSGGRAWRVVSVGLG